MVKKMYLIAALTAGFATGCSDFAFNASINTGRYEMHEILANGREGLVVPQGSSFELIRNGSSIDDVLPIRFRLVHANEADRELLFYSECENACNGSVNCTGKTVIREAAAIIINPDGLIDYRISSWQCTFDDDTTFLILS